MLHGIVQDLACGDMVGYSIGPCEMIGVVGMMLWGNWAGGRVVRGGVRGWWVW